MAKLLLLLNGAGGESLAGELKILLPDAFVSQPGLTVQLMAHIENDPFYDPSSPLPGPQVVLELMTVAGGRLADSYESLAHLLQGLPVAAGSLALVMHQRRYIPAAPQQFHYHQLMFRREGLTHADYMDYYTHFHCRMGLNTPGISGYSQNYVDPVASESLARRLGLTTVGADSISELGMESVDQFIAYPKVGELGSAAAKDEARFVDRARNVAFCSEVLLRVGDFDGIHEAAYEQHFPA